MQRLAAASIERRLSDGGDIRCAYGPQGQHPLVDRERRRVSGGLSERVIVVLLSDAVLCGYIHRLSV